MRTSWLRRPWFLRPRSLFESMRRLAGWEESRPDEPPMFPKVRLDLFRLERREVVSETLNALVAGWAIGSLSSLLNSDDVITSEYRTSRRATEPPQANGDFSWTVNADWPSWPDVERSARPAEMPSDQEPPQLVDPFADPLSMSDDESEPFYAMSMGGYSSSFDSDSGTGGGGSADFAAPVLASATATVNTAAGGPEFTPAMEVVALTSAVAKPTTTNSSSAASAPEPVAIPRSLQVPNPSRPKSEPATPMNFRPDSLTHPSYVIDANKGTVLSEAVINHDFSGWTVDLRAQVSDATVVTYTWDYSGAPELESPNAEGHRFRFTWESFNVGLLTPFPQYRDNTIVLTEDFGGSVTQQQTFHFRIVAADARAAQSAPTSTGTWPTVATPDMLQSSASAMGGPHHWVTMADGSVSTAIDLPRYSPSVDPTRLVYNSMAADPRPIFLTRYQIDPAQAVPSTVDARLTVNGSPGTTYTYSTANLNPGDFMPIALQHNATGLSTGRYTWEVKVKANYVSPVTSTYSGSFNHVNNGSSPYGAGWWVDGLDRLVSGSGGMMLVQADGRSLWFTWGDPYGSPAGDFSTLVEHESGFTRTLHDGTVHSFNPSGELTNVVDRNNNTTTYTYSGGRLSTITDPNNQVTTFAYDGSSKLDYVTDPASRTTQITVSSGKLTAATDPASGAWAYAYDGSGRLTNITDPRSKITTIAYDGSANRAQTVSQADGATESYVPWQLRGLPTGGTTTATLYAAATADFTDGRSKTWQERLDWLGFGQRTQAVDPLGDTEIAFRNPHGLMYVDSNGNGHRRAYEYNGSGDMTTLTWENDAAREEYTFNAYGQVLTHKNPINHTTTYQYDANGNLTTITNALNENTTATYTADGLLKAVTDGNSKTTTFGYDATDRMTTLTNARSLTTILGYDSASNLTTVTDPLSRTTTYAYNNMGRLTQITLPDDDGNPSNNPVWAYAPDGLGLTSTVTNPLTEVTTYGYDNLGRLKTITDGLNHTTTYGYDNTGNLTTIRDPLNRLTTMTYDDAGNLATRTDANNHTTTFAFDAGKQLINTLEPLGRTTTFSYNFRGQMAARENPDGSGFSYDYCLCGCIVGTARYAYTALDVPQWTEVWNYTLDNLGRVRTATDGENNTTTYTFDAAGNLQAVTDPLNHTTTYGSNAVNQLESIKDPLNHITTIGYDNAGNREWVKDPLNHITTFSHDAQNRQKSILDAEGGRTTFTYDLAGRLKTLTDPMNNTTTYGYDAAGNTTTVVDPNNKTTTYHYDAADQLDYMLDRRGQRTEYTYDNIGQVKTEKWKNVFGATIYTATYTYNAMDELTQAVDNYSGYSYDYDLSEDGTILTIDNLDTPTSPHVTLTVHIDPTGVRRSISGSEGMQVNYDYDDALRLIDLNTTIDESGGPRVTFGYDAASRLTGLTRNENGGGNKINSVLAYDNANRMTTITHSSTVAGTLSQMLYAYDNANRLTDYSGPEGSRYYLYDDTNQLTEVYDALSGDDIPIEEFSYDLAGNRTGGYSTTTGNRMTADGTYTYTYDDNGNTSQRRKTSDGTVADYTWDYRNRLTNIKHRAAIGGTITYEATYTYDVFDRRIGILEDSDGTGGSSSVQTWTVYDGANAWADFAANGSLTMRYLNGYGMDERYARIAANGDVRWYLTDFVNSVRQIVQSNGTVVWSANYSAFGTILNPSGAGGDRFKYTGREWDAGTEQYYYRARYYGADVGRFRSEDPIGFAAGDVSLYRYVTNSPVLAMDPSGMKQDVILPIPNYRPNIWDNLPYEYQERLVLILSIIRRETIKLSALLTIQRQLLNEIAKKSLILVDQLAKFYKCDERHLQQLHRDVIAELLNDLEDLYRRLGRIQQEILNQNQILGNLWNRFWDVYWEGVRAGLRA